MTPAPDPGRTWIVSSLKAREFMPNAFLPFDVTANRKRYFFGLAIVAIGYTTALIGCLFSLRIPMALTSGMMVCGLLAATLLPGWIAPRLGIKGLSRAFFPTYLIGTLSIAAILAMFADYDWKTWYFHPTGFQSIWIVLVIAFFHLSGILKNFGMKNHYSDIAVSEYNENQTKNPYSPPMRPQLRTNNPEDRSGGSAVS